MSANKKRNEPPKNTLVGEGSMSMRPPLDGDEEEAQLTPDWRLEMRQEIRSALAEIQNKAPLQLPIGPTEIDAADVLESEPFIDIILSVGYPIQLAEYFAEYLVE